MVSNAINILMETFQQHEGDMPFVEWVIMESENDPNFFRWLFDEPLDEDFDPLMLLVSLLTESQKAKEYRNFLISAAMVSIDDLFGEIEDGDYKTFLIDAQSEISSLASDLKAEIMEYAISIIPIPEDAVQLPSDGIRFFEEEMEYSNNLIHPIKANEIETSYAGEEDVYTYHSGDLVDTHGQWLPHGSDGLYSEDGTAYCGELHKCQIYHHRNDSGNFDTWLLTSDGWDTCYTEIPKEYFLGYVRVMEWSRNDGKGALYIDPANKKALLYDSSYWQGQGETYEKIEG